MISPVLVFGQCPDCGGRGLMPVATREGLNFSCLDCRQGHHQPATVVAVGNPYDSDAEDDDPGWSDIESELYSSAREVGVECSPPLS